MVISIKRLYGQVQVMPFILIWLKFVENAIKPGKMDKSTIHEKISQYKKKN